MVPGPSCAVPGGSACCAQSLPQPQPTLKTWLVRRPISQYGPADHMPSSSGQGNLSYGICTDFVLGDFDHTRGGHLVLHKSRHIAALRPGAILLFPSSCITHENIPIQASESRFSMTTYSSGGLRRFATKAYRLEGN